jgi:hypothetical protein
LITALNGLLSARNSLISSWIDYEIQRITLFKDFDLMNIDARGVWTNDDRVPTIDGRPAPITPDPVGAPTEPLYPPPEPRSSNPFARP